MKQREKERIQSRVLVFCVGVLLGIAVTHFTKKRQMGNQLWYQDMHHDTFLGPQEGDHPPKRLQQFSKQPSKESSDTPKRPIEQFTSQPCWPCGLLPPLISKLKFNSVLLLQSGNGYALRLLRQRYAKSAWGVDSDPHLLNAECPDLVDRGIVEAANLTQLPYQDGQFDLVAAFDALELLGAEEVGGVVREMVRVSRRHIFLTISLCSPVQILGQVENGSRVDEGGRVKERFEQGVYLQRPRGWWEQQFWQAGANTTNDLVWAMQASDTSYNREDMWNCLHEGESEEAAKDDHLFETCLVSHQWLEGRNDKATLRKQRCMTTSNSQLEPWVFAFHKLHGGAGA